jgi:hypothetical protein
MTKAVVAGQRPLLDADLDTGYAEVMRSCWVGDPAARPSFATAENFVPPRSSAPPAAPWRRAVANAARSAESFRGACRCSRVSFPARSTREGARQLRLDRLHSCSRHKHGPWCTVC